VKPHFVAIRKPEQVRKASHCGSKQQERLHDHSIIACSRHIYMLFFTHIPFMVNHAFSTMPPEQSETEWLCVDVTGYKIINIYNLHAHDSLQRPSHTPACTLATSIASTSTGVTAQHRRTVRAWTPGQHATTLDCGTTQRKQPVSSLAVETSAPAQT